VKNEEVFELQYRTCICMDMDSKIDKEKGEREREREREREGQFGLRISVKGTRRKREQ
jgi:hypothetical protein